MLPSLVMSLSVGVWTSGQKKMWCMLKKNQLVQREDRKRKKILVGSNK